MYVITFKDGRQVKGIPWAQALVSMERPVFTFKQDNGRLYSFLFADIAEAKIV